LRFLIVGLVLSASTASANGREDYLVGLLRKSDAFRVRAQAAISLGQLDKTNRTVAALERAVGWPLIPFISLAIRKSAG